MQISYFFSKLALITPALFGVLLMPSAWFRTQFWAEVLIRQGSPFFLFLLFCTVFRLQLLNIKPRAAVPTAQTKREELLLIFNLIICASSVALSLAYIAQHFTQLFLLFSLLSLILGLLSDRFDGRGASAQALASRFAYLCVVAFLSCMALLGVVRWQAFGLSIAIAASLLSLQAVRRMQGIQAPKTFEFSLAALALCLGPVLFASFSMSGVLPRYWLLALLPLALSQPHLQALKGGKDQLPLDRASLLRDATGIYWLFVVTLVLIRICFRWS